jgi:lysylphosphatidylglycerol synthetase-like protein (DUF2156 family)
MELRGIWAFNALFAMLPALMFARLAEHHSGPVTPLVREFIYALAFFALAMFPVRFAGTGLATSKGFRAPRGADPSLLFTLSLPVRRRTLFFYRTGFCLLAIESLAILGLVMGAVVLAPSGGLMQVFADGLWILLLMVPLYFLDSLLSIRFDAVSITQVQILGGLALWFVSSRVGVNLQRVVAVLSGIAPINLALVTLLAAAGLAGVTVWRLNRHDY